MWIYYMKIFRTSNENFMLTSLPKFYGWLYYGVLNKKIQKVCYQEIKNFRWFWSSFRYSPSKLQNLGISSSSTVKKVKIFSRFQKVYHCRVDLASLFVAVDQRKISWLSGLKKLKRKKSIGKVDIWRVEKVSRWAKRRDNT